MYKTFGVLSVFVFFVMVEILYRQIKRVQKNQTELRRLNENLMRFINLQQSIVILTDGKKFKFANQSFYRFFGYNTLEEFQKKHQCICELFENNKHFFKLSDVKKSEAHWIESLLNLPPTQRIVSIKDHDNISHVFMISLNVFDENYYVVSFNDISETIIEKLRLEKLATRDQLTGVFNRTYFETSISFIESLFKEQQLYIAILYFDIDHFKNINDTYGHFVGDEIFKALTLLIQKHIRQEDHLIRWGGEEFLIVAGVASLDIALNIAEHLRQTIQNHTFQTVNHLTCSFGVVIKNSSETIEETIIRADQKLYEAKQSGRNQVR